MKSIAIIGQGVIGLTSAEALLNAGYHVDIISKDDLPMTSSMGAGAYWWPHKAYPPQRVSLWSKVSYNRYKELSAIAGSGIYMHEHFRYCIIDDETRYALELTDSWEIIEQKDIPFNVSEAFRCIVPIMDVPVFMPWLKATVQKLGARFITRELSSLDELHDEYDIMINCSGLGAKSLADDSTVYPIRGQILRMEKPADFSNSFRLVHQPPGLTLILPRSGDLLLGGTTSENDFNTTPSEADTHAIIERCAKVVPEVRDLKLLGTSAALRPGRPEVRLDAQTLSNGSVVIHNYGHGGSGYTVAFGCAVEVLEILKHVTS